MEPKWIGIKGALATRSPSGANSAQEKSRRSLILVLIEVCCNDRPIASATLMKRLAKRVSRIGSGPLLGVFVFGFSIDIVYAEVEVPSVFRKSSIKYGIRAGITRRWPSQSQPNRDVSWMASTLSEYIQSQDELVREAALALPHQFSKCTYSLGPLRYYTFSTG